MQRDKIRQELVRSNGCEAREVNEVIMISSEKEKSIITISSSSSSRRRAGQSPTVLNKSKRVKVGELPCEGKSSAGGFTDVTLNDFTVGKLLGKGGFGTVHLCTKNSTKELFAIKMCKRDCKRSKIEARILAKLDHPFVLSSNCSFENEAGFYIIMPVVDGGDMYEMIIKYGSLSEVHTKFYAAELVSAIGYLHSLNIIHRDIKLGNILLQKSGHIKLCDFGLSTQTNCNNLVEKVGTPNYMPPEMFGGSYNYAVDWWSLGVLLYRILCGTFPFRNHTEICSKKPTFRTLLNRILSSGVKSLLVGFLDKDPTTRLGGGVTDSVEVQNHFFFWEN